MAGADQANLGVPVASMRPRVFPAENVELGYCAQSASGQRASMRPRVFPAEDTLVTITTETVDNTRASMRPRVFPAENQLERSESAARGATLLQ